MSSFVHILMNLFYDEKKPEKKWGSGKTFSSCKNNKYNDLLILFHNFYVKKTRFINFNFKIILILFLFNYFIFNCLFVVLSVKNIVVILKLFIFKIKFSTFVASEIVNKNIRIFKIWVL
ncbi:hypothetical protein CCYN2B_10055 [Capnocytophaga cynodegmi]|uniref:Uncharacterized protein n=1 Tax=Capnocytophaga cynodegmi TaxID=28189 RepID=A0A0B7GZ20_9FLAO|nr:hypothetical protein CCYN2B_10055 [Capnocytophaga cynodegmi]